VKRAYLGIVPNPPEFLVTVGGTDEEVKFPGTVDGAIALREFLDKGEFDLVQNSSDYNHPLEFPAFEKYSIDIVVGEFDEAVAAGVISVEKDLSEEEEGTPS
jgi:hypothetical protein